MTIAERRRASPAGDPVLSVIGATKRFAAILALNEVSIEVRRGEILALLGDNGAGKSTLIKCISGVHELDSGQIILDGAAATIETPADARDLGIETVYQDLALFDNLGPAKNFMGPRAGVPGVAAASATAAQKRRHGPCDARASCPPQGFDP